MNSGMTSKKNVLPSKASMNLYYKEDKTTRPSTIALYVLFALTVLLALAKVAIYDPLMELNETRETLAAREKHLEEQLIYLEDYDRVSSDYSRYSYNYLREEEKLRDRMEVMEMLEETVLEHTTIEMIAMRDNVISLSYYGLTLERTAALVRSIETYEFVQNVEVHTASRSADDGGLATTMLIQVDGTGGND